jgi:endonuclease/exonuclease/phosphatase family metal-dependent hydrolase
MYDINGNQINTARNISGATITQAYDINGNPLITYDLAVMTYNVQKFTGRNSNQTMQERIIQAYNPDIVGLQELGDGTMPSLGVTLFADYPNQFLGSDTNKSGIVSKYTLTNSTFYRLYAESKRNARI